MEPEKRKNGTISVMDKNKSIILMHINKSPGIRYRELVRETGFSNGVISYHLKILEKSRLIKVSRYYRWSTRYYPLNITTKESHILEYIRRTTAKQIVLFLLQHDQLTFNDILQYTGKVPSTVSWHLLRLKEGRTISVKNSRNHMYRLRNRHTVARLMDKNQNFSKVVP